MPTPTISELLRTAADYIDDNVRENEPVMYNGEEGDRYSLVDDLLQAAEDLEAGEKRALL